MVGGQGGVDPHCQQTEVGETLVAGAVEGEFVLEEVEFEEQYGEVLFVDEKEGGEDEKLPVVEEAEEGAEDADEGDGEEGEGGPVVFEGEEGDEVEEDASEVFEEDVE